jgi:hypothetical protein
MNKHLYMEGLDFKPMSAMMSKIELHSKNYSQTLRELKDHNPGFHRESIARLSSRGSVRNSSQGSLENSTFDSSNENSCFSTSKAPKLHRGFKLRPGLRPYRLGADSLTERVLAPLTVFGIVEDEEGESPEKKTGTDVGARILRRFY